MHGPLPPRGTPSVPSTAALLATTLPARSTAVNATTDPAITADRATTVAAAAVGATAGATAAADEVTAATDFTAAIGTMVSATDVRAIFGAAARPPEGAEGTGTMATEGAATRTIAIHARQRRPTTGESE